MRVHIKGILDAFYFPSARLLVIWRVSERCRQRVVPLAPAHYRGRPLPPRPHYILLHRARRGYPASVPHPNLSVSTVTLEFETKLNKMMFMMHFF